MTRSWRTQREHIRTQPFFSAGCMWEKYAYVRAVVGLALYRAVASLWSGGIAHTRLSVWHACFFQCFHLAEQTTGVG